MGVILREAIMVVDFGRLHARSVPADARRATFHTDRLAISYLSADKQKCREPPVYNNIAFT